MSAAAGFGVDPRRGELRSRPPATGRWLTSSILAALAIALLFAAPVSGADATSYFPRSWTTRDGLPGHRIRAFAQDRDGYLWIGTEGGLARFDGFRFITWDLGEQSETTQLGISTLFVAADGSLWVSYSARARVDRIQGDRVTTFWPSDGLITGTVRTIFQDSSGQMWAGGRGGLSAFRDGRWGRVPLGAGLSNITVTALFEDPAGTLWVATLEGVFRQQGRTGTFTKVDAPASLAQGFVTDVDRRLLVLDHGLRPHALTGASGATSRLKISDPSLVGSPAEVFADRDGYWWVTFRGKGLIRVNPNPPHAWETFTVDTGLSGNQVTALFQDREGSVWVGTENGVTQLSAGNISTFLPLDQLPVPRVLTADQSGGIWIGTHTGLVRAANGQTTVHRSEDGLLTAGILAIHADQEGAIWIATADGLVRYWHGAFQRIPLPVQLRTISALAMDRQGVLWIADNENGLYWWDRHTLRHVPNPPGLWYQQVSSFYVDTRGRVWVGLFSGGVAVYDGHQFSYPYGAEGHLPGAVVSILEETGDLFLFVTTAGLTWVRYGDASTVSSPVSIPISRLTAAVESANGDLWIAAEDRILKIEHTNRQNLARQPSVLRYDVYDDSDGLVGNVSLFARGYPKAALDQAGDFWFITTSGVGVLKPPSGTAQHQLPDVTIDAVWVDDEPLEPTSTPLLPTGVSRLQFDYNVVSLRAPKKLRFQHMLEGLDTDWVDNGANRQATYAALSSGHYRFRVRAHVDGADWPENSTVWEFDVPPVFYQTAWFALACLGTAVMMGWGVWRFRVRQIHTRFALVMSERSRMAREIHDTLLQNLVGLGLHLDNVSDEVVQGYAPDALRSRLRSIRRQVEESVADARLSVWNLRRPNDAWPAFCEALRHACERIAENSTVLFRFNAHGAASPVPGIVQEHVLRIVQEAMNNAIRHSGATAISLDVFCARRSITIRISDNGRGFDVNRPMTDVNGHWGITFMHERAQQIGGRVDIVSSPSQGTTVECNVPLSNPE